MYFLYIFCIFSYIFIYFLYIFVYFYIFLYIFVYFCIFLYIFCIFLCIFYGMLETPRNALIFTWLAIFMIPVVQLLRDEDLLGPRYTIPSWDFDSFHPLANFPTFLFGMCLARMLPELERKIASMPAFIPKIAESVSVYFGTQNRQNHKGNLINL